MEKPGVTHDETGGQAPPGFELVEIDPVVEKRMLRKVDVVLVGLLFLCYLFGFLDRSTIGNAETAGMGKDLGYDESQYQWLLTIFYIPYIVFEFLAIMWKIVPPHWWAFATVLVCGISASLEAAAFNWAGLMVCRFFLAAAEAGYGPGVPFLLSFFYRRRELGLRCGIFLSAAPLATTFAGAMAYGITQSDHLALESWRVLFLVQGLPTVALAVAVFFFLPDSPETARFLTADEQRVARARAIQQTGHEGASRVGMGGITVREVLSTFKAPQTLILPFMYFSCNVSFASLPVFLPTILTTMGYTSITAQGMTAPPYFLAFLVCIGTTYLADRLRQRGLIIALLSTMGAVGYVLLATVSSSGVRYFAVFLAAAGVFPSIANILPWVVNNQGSDTKRGVGVALLNTVGQCGPLLGTRLFPRREQPHYVKGMAVCAAFMFFNALLALTLRQYLAGQNRKLARAEEAAEAAAAAAAVTRTTTTGGVDGVDGMEKGGYTGTEQDAEMEGTLGYRYVL